MKFPLTTEQRPVSYGKVLEAVRKYAAGFRDFDLPAAQYAIAGQLGYNSADWLKHLIRRALDQLAAEGSLTAYPRGAELPGGGTSRFREYRTPVTRGSTQRAASRTPLQAEAAAREAARARSRQLAGELTRLGVPAEAAPGGDRAGVWLDGGDAELAIAVLKRSAAQGERITREHFGLPPAAPMPAEFTPYPEYQPQPGPVSEQMLEDAVTAYNAQPDGRRGMIAAMAAAGLGDEVTDRGLLDTAQAVFAHEVFVRGLGARKGMTETLATVLARTPLPAGFAGSGVRAEVLDGCPACGVTQLGWSQAGCTHPYHRTGDGVVLSYEKPLLEAPVTGDPVAHDQRLRDGWATWEQVLADAPGKHEHAHTRGPFFAHKHPGGDTPHDHRPGDTRIPAVVRREYRREQEGRPL